jgi:antitoxin PrlF
MTAIAKLTSKGQVTIPRSVRKHLNVDTGSMLVFEVVKNRVVVRPARTLYDLAGALKGRRLKGRDSEAMRRSAKAHVSRRVMGRG